MEKTDPGDAFLIADFARVGRRGKLRPFKAAQHLALKRLTRERFHLAERPLNDIVDYFKSTSKNRCDDYGKIASLFDKAIRSTYRLDKTAYDPITISITASINLIQCIESQIRMVDKAIEKEMKGLYPNAYQSLMSIIGIGPVFAAGILSEIGDISYFRNDASLARYTGFHWKKNDSDNFAADEKHSANSCNKYLRYYITQATQMSVMHGFDYTTPFYHKKYNEASTHRHKRALVLTSRKLVRLIYVLLRDSKLYVSVSHDTVIE